MGESETFQNSVTLAPHIRSAVTTPMPKSIATAISKVAGTMGAVTKSGYNQHGGYKFSSTDDIYAATTNKLASVGLVILTLEDSHEIIKTEKPAKQKGVFVKDADGNPIKETVQWLRVTFRFILATDSDTWEHDKFRRTIMVQITGPQTFQGAQSFAEKAMLRSLFKLPTGDVDLDMMPQGETIEAQQALNQPPSRKSSSAAKKDGTDETFNAIRKDITQATSRDHLAHLRSAYADEWAAMPTRWAELLDQEYADRMDSFPT
jgi:hypothetical protein